VQITQRVVCRLVFTNLKFLTSEVARIFAAIDSVMTYCVQLLLQDKYGGLLTLSVPQNVNTTRFIIHSNTVRLVCGIIID